MSGVERVVFDRVSKRYALGAQVTAREALVAAARRLVSPRRGGRQELWSLRDVSFSVGEGEALGIIGRNGAGKSTALKVLAGITSPTSGVCRTRGRVAALLEVGTGFHPELTGRENIYLNGAVLGMSRRDTARRFDAIVGFSGVERFLDTPVKHYSSGMGLRLGFAVAAHLEPDVLVVDEILAVGDAEFQRRCIARLGQAGREGRTVVVVSHDLRTLTALCDQALWLDGGQVRGRGPAHRIVHEYLEAGMALANGGAITRSGPLVLRSVRVVTGAGRVGLVLERGEGFTVEIAFTLADVVPVFNLSISISSLTGSLVLDEALHLTGGAELAAGSYHARMHVPPVLNVGDFALNVWFGDGDASVLWQPSVLLFSVTGDDLGRPHRAVVLDLPITLEPLEADQGVTAR